MVGRRWRLPARPRHGYARHAGPGQLDSRGGAEHGYAQPAGLPPRFGTLSLQSRLSGQQFDDDANQYRLPGYFRLDAYASHDFGKRFELFTAGENLFDRQIVVAKTPTTTLAGPRVGRAGILVRLGGTGK